MMMHVQMQQIWVNLYNLGITELQTPSACQFSPAATLALPAGLVDNTTFICRWHMADGQQNGGHGHQTGLVVWLCAVYFYII